MTVTTLHPRRPAEVCPATHHEPNPSRPVTCPSWCQGAHAARLWPACCSLVTHSTVLAVSRCNSLSVTLDATEDHDAGMHPARIAVLATEHDMLDLTPERAEDYAVTIRRAAIRARQIIADCDPS